MAFDPDAAASPDAGLFGLPGRVDEAAVVVLPVPFDATTSYRSGTALGPAAVLEASHQVDLWDPQTGDAWRRGFALDAIPTDVAELSARMRARARPILEAGGPRPEHAADDAARIAEVDSAGESIRTALRQRTRDLHAAGRLVGVLGGDHSVPQGAIEAAAERFGGGDGGGGFGILHVDAHMDLRVAYEGFRYSHASIMHNVLDACGGGVERLVQVGIRDCGHAEVERMRGSEGRIRTFFELDVRRRLAGGETLRAVLGEIVAGLPAHVWVSFDVDGLDPALCPGTGTPVPGGLTFVEACLLLETLQSSGRRIVGFDLCEVAPRDLADWDAAVGARLLYKLCGFAVLASPF